MDKQQGVPVPDFTPGNVDAVGGQETVACNHQLLLFSFRHNVFLMPRAFLSGKFFRKLCAAPKSILLIISIAIMLMV